ILENTRLSDDPRTTACDMRRQRLDGIDLRIRQAGGDPGSLEPGQRLRGFIKIISCRRLDPIDPFSHLAYVEIHLQDALLPPDQLDHERKIDFEPLSDPVASLPEKDIFRDLLTDRAGA